MELTAEEREVLTRVLQRLLGEGDEAHPPLSLRERRRLKREQANGHDEKKD